MYLGYRAAYALQLGLTFVDVEHLLAWRCVRQRHGVMVHVVVIVVSSVLKAAMPDFMMRQDKLITFKLSVTPLLFHGAVPLASSAPRAASHVCHNWPCCSDVYCSCQRGGLFLGCWALRS